MPAGAAPVVATPTGAAMAVRRDLPPPVQQQQQQQQQQLYGHEPGFRVTDHLCLIGCCVLVIDYQRHVATGELHKWLQVLASRGASVEAAYSQRVTHVVCETSRSPLAQQALRDGKRLVTAFWLSDVLLKDQLAPPTQVLHFPTPYADGDKPCRKMLASLSGFEGEPMQDMIFEIPLWILRYWKSFLRYWK